MKYKINKGHITQKIDNKVTIFSGEDSVLYTLNETGAFIFQSLKMGWEKEKIIKKMTEKYHINEAEAKADVEYFTEHLLEKKILTKQK